MKKQLIDEERTVAALDALHESVYALQKFGAGYDAYIDEAVLHSDDASAKQLIKQKICVYTLIEWLKMLKSNIELGVYTVYAISELSKLPGAISECLGFLAEPPDLALLKTNITPILKDVIESETEFGILNDSLDPETVDENSDRFQAEYSLVSVPFIARAQRETKATDEIDFTNLIKKELMKK